MKQRQVNDTMIRYSPETGYPVNEARGRRRVQAVDAPVEPLRQRLVRLLFRLGAGLLVLLAVAWVVLGVASNVPALQAQVAADRSVEQLFSTWESEQPTSRPATGEAWAALTIPEIGLTDMVVLEGTEAEQINAGVGHYEQTEYPSDLAGNVGLAGHRTGWGEPFADLDELQPGDEIILETSDAVYTYTMTGSTVVTPEEVWVLEDAPPGTNASGTAPLLTLTTCEGGENEVRLVVWAELTDVAAK